jgi:hypothetical protein
MVSLIDNIGKRVNIPSAFLLQAEWFCSVFRQNKKGPIVEPFSC